MVNEISTITTQQTMSSLELVSLINQVRKQENPAASELRHDHFMDKVLKVLGGEAAPKFRGSYKGADNTDRPCYNLPKREAVLMVMSESYKVQAAVYDRMVELETVVRANLLPIEEAEKHFNVYERMVNKFGVKGNHALIAANNATVKDTGVNFMLNLGRSHLVNETQTQHLTPTELGTLAGISAVQVNKKLEKLGYQVKSENKWVVTDTGMSRSVILDTGKKHSTGSPVTQIKWNKELVDTLNQI